MLEVSQKMTECEREKVNTIMQTDVDELQPILDTATVREIALAWDESMARMADVGANKYPPKEHYRHELIVKEMSKRGFINFGGCFGPDEGRAGISAHCKQALYD